MKMYCYQCGYGMTYNGAPPNFCMQCGAKTGDVRAQAQDSVEEVAQEEAEQAEEQESVTASQEPEETLPTLEGLEVDFEIPKNSFTFGEIAGTSAPSQGNDDYQTPKAKRESKKQFLENFKKEAGSLREKGDGK